jgi:hypothetical protein
MSLRSLLFSPRQAIVPAPGSCGVLVRLVFAATCRENSGRLWRGWSAWRHGDPGAVGIEKQALEACSFLGLPAILRRVGSM